MRVVCTIRDTGVFSWAENYKRSTGRINWPCGLGGSRNAGTAVRMSKPGAGKMASVSRPTTNGSAGCLKWLKRSRRFRLQK